MAPGGVIWSHCHRSGVQAGNSNMACDLITGPCIVYLTYFMYKYRQVTQKQWHGAVQPNLTCIPHWWCHSIWEWAPLCHAVSVPAINDAALVLASFQNVMVLLLVCTCVCTRQQSTSYVGGVLAGGYYPFECGDIGNLTRHLLFWAGGRFFSVSFWRYLGQVR